MVSAKKADEIFEQIKDKLKGQEGKMVAIETDSGDYFIGDDTAEAIEAAKKKYPMKQFYLKRVGAKYAYFVGAI